MGTLSRFVGWAGLAGLMPFFLGSLALAQEPQGEWDLSIGARESNEFDRTVNDVGQEDLILDNVNFALGYRTRTERSQYALFGRAGANAYREGDTRNNFTFGAGLTWLHVPSTRFNSTITAGANRGFQAETLTNLGVLAPGADSSAAQASWGIEYRTSPKTTVSLGLGYQYLRVESDQPVTGSQIVAVDTPFGDEFPTLFPPRRDDEGLTLPDSEGEVIDIIATEGFRTLSTRSQSGFTSFGVSRAMSEYTTLGFDVGGGYRTIDRLDAVNQEDGALGSFRLWTLRKAGTSAYLGATYEARRSLIQDPATTIQNVSGSYALSPQGSGLSIRLQGGASHYLAENGVSSWTPIADASLSAMLTRATRISLWYRRQFAQSLGFGQTLLIDYGNASLNQKFGEKVDLTILAGGSFGTDPQIEGSRYDAVRAGATLGYAIVPSFRIGTSFFVLRTEAEDFRPPYETRRNLVSVFATYTATWR
jgi:hypothetical protein